jgi:TRAP-type transport system small permease protein
MVRAEPPLRAKLGRALLRAIDLVSRFVALWCGGALLGVLMLLIIVDVTGRYLFSSPLYGSLDLSITILVLVVAASLAYGGRTGAHVTADIFTTLVSARIEWLTGLFVKFFAAAVTALWCWRLFVTGRTAARLGESTMLLNIPFEPIYQALGAGVGLFAVVLLIEGVVLALTGHVPQLVDESRVAMDVRTGGEDAP